MTERLINLDRSAVNAQAETFTSCSSAGPLKVLSISNLNSGVLVAVGLHLLDTFAPVPSLDSLTFASQWVMGRH